MAYLRREQGDFPLETIELCSPRVIFGRHSTCSVRFDADVISRHHAQILATDGTYVLEDLGSNNGTLLNGVALTRPVPLQDGDEIRLCSYVFSFHAAAPVEAPAPLAEAAARIGLAAYDPIADRRTVPDIDQSGWCVPIASGGDDPSELKSTVVARLNANAEGRESRLSHHPEAKLRAVLNMSGRLCRALTLDEVFATVLDGLASTFPQMDEGAVLLQEASGELAVKATRDARGRTGRQVSVSRTVTQAALDSGEAILIRDVADDARFSSSESLFRLRIRSLMCVPMFGAEAGRGVIVIAGRSDHRFDEADLDVLVSAAAQIALAIQSARLHEQVRQSHRFAESIIETVRDALVVLDGDFRVVSANRAFYRLFRVTAEQVIGKVLLNAPFGLIREPGVHEWLANALESDAAPDDLEVDLEVPETGRRALCLAARRVEGGLNRRLLLVAVQDLTARKQAEERARMLAAELSHASRVSLVGEMAAGIAHELHQPLSVVVNYASGCERRLKQGGVARDDLLESLREINLQALRAGEIVRCIRRFVQKRNINPQHVDLNDIVEDALQLASFARRRHQTRLDFQPGANLPPAHADRIQVAQVVLNLIVNAIESMADLPEDERVVTVRTACRDELEIAVTDGGRGVPPEIQEKIFEQFYTTRTDGLGIGLAISRSIIEAHGGRLWVESPPGQGATFRFTLPKGRTNAPLEFDGIAGRSA